MLNADSIKSIYYKYKKNPTHPTSPNIETLSLSFNIDKLIVTIF